MYRTCAVYAATLPALHAFRPVIVRHTFAPHTRDPARRWRVLRVTRARNPGKVADEQIPVQVSHLKQQLVELQAEKQDAADKADSLSRRAKNLLARAQNLTEYALEKLNQGDEASARQTLQTKASIQGALEKASAKASHNYALAQKLDEVIAVKQLQLLELLAAAKQLPLEEPEEEREAGNSHVEARSQPSGAGWSSPTLRSYSVDLDSAVGGVEDAGGLPHSVAAGVEDAGALPAGLPVVSNDGQYGVGWALGGGAAGGLPASGSSIEGSSGRVGSSNSSAVSSSSSSFLPDATRNEDVRVGTAAAAGSGDGSRFMAASSTSTGRQDRSTTGTRLQGAAAGGAGGAVAAQRVEAADAAGTVRAGWSTRDSMTEAAGAAASTAPAEGRGSTGGSEAGLQRDRTGADAGKEAPGPLAGDGETGVNEAGSPGAGSAGSASSLGMDSKGGRGEGPAGAGSAGAGGLGVMGGEGFGAGGVESVGGAAQKRDRGDLEGLLDVVGLVVERGRLAGGVVSVADVEAVKAAVEALLAKRQRLH